MASTGQIRRQEVVDMYYMVIIVPVYWRYSTHKLSDLAWSSYRAVCPHHTPNPSYKLQCSVGKPCSPTFSLQIRTKNLDGQIGAEMNYFHGSEKAGFWEGEAGFRRVLVWVLVAGRAENPVRACPP